MAQINMPAGPQDAVGALGGLAQVYNAVAGNAMERRLKTAQAQQVEDQNNGILGTKETAELMSKGKSVPEGTPGAFGFTHREAAPDGTLGPVQKAFILPNRSDSEISNYLKALEIKLKQQELDDKQHPKPTDAQKTAATVGTRLQSAQNDFKALEDSGYKSSGLWSSIQKSGYFPEGLKSENVKKEEASESQFLSAALTKDGTDVSRMTPQAIEMMKAQFFPRQGDSDEIIKQKAQSRQLVADGAINLAGKAYTGAPAPSQVASRVAAPHGSNALNAGFTGGGKVQPATVIQNGHTYILNPKTGKYE